MARFKLFVEYAGTRYSGWQIQKNARTVQGELTRVVEKVSGQRQFELYGSGRTDAGVHALEQIAHLDIITFAKNFVWWVRDDIDVNKMRAAAQRFAGMQDFRSFTDDDAGEKSTVVAIERVEVAEDGDLVLIRIEGSHFLWKMVRRMVGVMVDVGSGGTTLDQAERFLHEESAVPAKLTAPASGLFLERVYYRGETRRPPLRGPVDVRFPR